LILIII